MIEAFTAYIKTIAAFILFAAFAEMLMSENSFKKYIQLIMGIMLLSVMLMPLFQLMHITNWNLDTWEYEQGAGGEGIINDEAYYTELENQRVMEAYEFMESNTE